MFATFLRTPSDRGHLYWVDDRFFVDEKVLQEVLGKSASSVEQAPPMGVAWVEFVKDKDRQAPRGPAGWYIRFARQFLQICEDFKIGFSVASFTYINQHLELTNDDQNCFLLDVQNLVDNEWDTETYGIHFAKNKKLLPLRCRLFSRLRGPDQTEDAMNILGVDANALDRIYITVDQGASNRVKHWLGEFLQRADPVAKAVRFYARPWREQDWPGKWNAPPNTNHDNPHYGRKLAEWLGVSINELGEDAFTMASKCLFIWQRDEHWQWHLTDTPSGQSANYKINGVILKAFWKHLGVSVNELSDHDDYRMPLNPALPFLLALCRFAAAANDEVPTLDWHRNVNADNIATQRVTVHCKQTDWALRNAFLDEKTPDRASVLLATLRSLLHGCVDISNVCFEEKAEVLDRAKREQAETPGGTADAKNDEWKIIFQGVRKVVKKQEIIIHETHIRVCGVSFTPGRVHLFWTNAAR